MAGEKKDLTTFEQLLQHLERPGAATRSGIRSLQKGENPLPAIKEGFTSPEKAPTGADIAEATGLQNPYALTALATLADVIDPTSFIPPVKGAALAAKAAPVVKSLMAAAPLLAIPTKAAAKSHYFIRGMDFGNDLAKAEHVRDYLIAQGKLPEGSLFSKGSEPDIYEKLKNVGFFKKD